MSDSKTDSFTFEDAVGAVNSMLGVAGVFGVKSIASSQRIELHVRADNIKLVSGIRRTAAALAKQFPVDVLLVSEGNPLGV